MTPGARLAWVVALVAAAAALSIGARPAPHSPVRDLASEVARCGIGGRVLERAGGLGTLVAVETVDCGGGALPLRGTVVMDRDEGWSGSPVAGVVRFVPLGREGFGRARAAAGAEASIDPIAVEVGDPDTLLGAAAHRFRSALTGAVSRLGGDRAALLRGLTIGDTSGLAPGTEDELRRAGLTHLVAVSGSNVAIVVGTVLLLAARLWRALRLALAGVVLLGYVLVVGPEPSVLRAAAMGALGLIALLAGRSSEPLAALGWGLAVVLVLRPQLVTSVGLHLSAAATLGLILWSGPLARMLPGPRPVALALGVTLAAQAAVSPILIAVFGEVSVTGPLANLAAAPVVPLATVGGLAAGTLALVAPSLGAGLAQLVGPAVGWILWVGQRLGAPGWAVAAPPAWSATLLALLLAVAGARSLSVPAAQPWEPFGTFAGSRNLEP